jgi:hypothetical protein
MNSLLGIALLASGIWLTVVQTKYLWNGKPDFSGGHIRLLICGIGCVVAGIIVIVQNI